MFSLQSESDSKPEIGRVVSGSKTENLKTATELRVEQDQLFDGVLDGDHPSQVTTVDRRRSARSDNPVSDGSREQFQERIRSVSCENQSNIFT